MNSLPDFPDQESADVYLKIFGQKLAGQHSLVTAVADKYFGKPEDGIPAAQLGLLIDLTRELMKETYPEWKEATATPCSTGNCPI